MTEIGTVMRSLRHARGLLLREVAAKVGVPLSFVSDIERGARMPGYERLEAFAAALGTSREYLAILRARAEMPAYLEEHPDIVRLVAKLRRNNTP